MAGRARLRRRGLRREEEGGKTVGLEREARRNEYISREREGEEGRRDCGGRKRLEKKAADQISVKLT